MNRDALAGKIDALLPQTQCAKCGYGGCMPYAVAIAAGEADINQCPPGGKAGIDKLARLLRLTAKPLNPANGAERRRTVAFIDEGRCIGCTLCIQACPVDAILGAAKRMHTVIAELCTGCDLCVPPCPVDCIDMLPLPKTQAPWTQGMADAARERFQFRSRRLARERRARRLAHKAQSNSGQGMADTKKAVILAAIERARARLAGTAAIDTRRIAAKKR